MGGQYFIFKSFPEYPALKQSDSSSCLSEETLLRNTETRLDYTVLCVEVVVCECLVLVE